jgi:hypothetical protein
VRWIHTLAGRPSRGAKRSDLSERALRHPSPSDDRSPLSPPGCVARSRTAYSDSVSRFATFAPLSAEDVPALRRQLRRTAEVAWRSEEDVERLRTRALRVCQETPALAQRLECVRTTQDKAEGCRRRRRS